MNRIVKRVLSVILALSVLSGCAMQATDVEAAATCDAKKAYAKMLLRHNKVKINSDDFNDASFSKDDKTYVNSFSLYDIDKDGVPELITVTPVNFRWFIVRMYTCKNGKVKAYRFANGDKVEFDDCSTAGGGYDFYICKSGHVHNDWEGEQEHVWQTYTVKNKKLKEITYTDSCERVDLKEYSNTSANRKKLKTGKI